MSDLYHAVVGPVTKRDIVVALTRKTLENKTQRWCLRPYIPVTEAFPCADSGSRGTSMSLVVTAVHTLRVVELDTTSGDVPLMTLEQVAHHWVLLVTCRAKLQECTYTLRSTKLEIAVDMGMSKNHGHTTVMYTQSHINTSEGGPQSWIVDMWKVWHKVGPFMHNILCSTRCKTIFGTSFDAATHC